MYPPIFQTCATDSDVVGLLGYGPVRLFPFGEAPQSVARPYATWQTVSGQPENYIDTVPDIDRFSIQIDAWGDTALDARIAAEALRNCIEPVAHVTSWRGESRDSETGLYRVAFDVDWWTERG